MNSCIPFSVICFLYQSGMTSDGYRRGYVSFAHFCYIELDSCQKGNCIEKTSVIGSRVLLSNVGANFILCLV